MKLIIAGSRHLKDVDIGSLLKRLDILHIDLEIVSGHGGEVDKAAEKFARDFHIDLVIFIPNWDRYGTLAGPLRNKRMAKYGDRLLAIWDGKSKGTKDMIRQMELLGKRVYLETVK